MFFNEKSYFKAAAFFLFFSLKILQLHNILQRINICHTNFKDLCYG